MRPPSLRSCLPVQLRPCLFPFVGWCVRLPWVLSSLVPLLVFLVWMMCPLFSRVLSPFVFHCAPACFPLLDGVSASLGSCLPLSPILHTLLLSLCWIARPPSQESCFLFLPLCPFGLLGFGLVWGLSGTYVGPMLGSWGPCWGHLEPMLGQEQGVLFRLGIHA